MEGGTPSGGQRAGARQQWPRRPFWEAFAMATGTPDCQLQHRSAEEETEASWAWEKWRPGVPARRVWWGAWRQDGAQPQLGSRGDSFTDRAEVSPAHVAGRVCGHGVAPYGDTRP